MTTEAVECADIRRNFVAGRVPAGPDVEAHVQGCPNCRELFENDARLGRQLAQAVLPEVEPGDLFARIDAELSRDVGARAQLRAPPTRWSLGIYCSARGRTSPRIPSRCSGSRSCGSAPRWSLAPSACCAVPARRSVPLSARSP